MLSFAVTYSNQLSPASFWLAVRPFSPERETCCMLSICRAFAFLAFIRKPSASLLQSARIAPSRESNLDSCRQRTKFAAFRYVLRPANLFFRVKRGFRGCFGVKNPIRNCIWKYVRNGFSAPKQDMDPDRPFYFFEPGWDTEVVSG